MEENKYWRNRYWTALKHVYFQYEEGNVDSECYYNLKELVEKETPKSIQYSIKENEFYCPNCRENLPPETSNYCSNCGQRLDWQHKELV